ncbi:MAG TPA: hypothetical protein DD379_08965, partial [Cyanobacteria bacterium UBA11162]|nr:hypothetical protein [Cyanobacteria bacterium UBA11162]
MSLSKKLLKAIQNLYQQMIKLSRAITKKLMNWLLRGLVVLGQRSRLARAGFILPTVTMVMLVVILLTTAIVFRSFDRAKNASNYRVNQAVLNAAQPAIDRAKRKLDELFASPNTRGTASETTLLDELQRQLSDLTDDKYTFADEDRLQITYKFNASSTETGLTGKQTTNEAWRFPVDTDNNGQFDSFTLYSIVFRSPSRKSDGSFNRERNPLEARTPPMDDGSVGGFCAAAQGTSASLVGEAEWYKSGSKLKKPFFIYVATVPIVNVTELGLDASKYENYTGQNLGFSGLEYQQDRSVLPPSNNAVVYNDDLDIFSGPDLRLNGRIFTNSNLFVSKQTYKDAGVLALYQVSSPSSCFYQPENAKIVVAGNLGYSDVSTISTGSANVTTDGGTVRVDLFVEDDTPTQDTISVDNKSVTEVSADMAYNTQAYEARINFLVTEGLKGTEANDPQEVEEKKQELISEFKELYGNSLSTQQTDEARRQAMELYFRNRTRRVPFIEVPAGTNEAFTASDIKDVGTEKMRPRDEWIYPFDPTDGTTKTNYSNLTLKTNGKKLLPPATKPSTIENGTETKVGDRALIGNGLPAKWWDNTTQKFYDNQGSPPKTQDLKDTEWDSPAGEGPRTRQTRAEILKDLDVASRDGFWERKAAQQPESSLSGVGGVRIVTGAGIYWDGSGDTSSNIVWPDTLPQPSDLANHPNQNVIFEGAGTRINDAANATRPYLRMRATAVYHYAAGTIKGETPIACVSTFYDPTTRDTARNRLNFAGKDLSDSKYDVSGQLAHGQYDDSGVFLGKLASRATLPGVANSVNGITYQPIAAASPDTDLAPQANLFYPNGRRVNQLLKDALDAKGAGKALSLAQQSAIDSASCALKILDGTLAPDDALIPHGTIQEVAFLDARQIKSNNPSVDPISPGVTGYDPANFYATAPAGVSKFTSNNYDLALEERQPLEIRATVVDLDKLRKIKIPGTSPEEYMIPNSGIVYVAREDALPDQTDTTNPANTKNNLKISATDFRLDPTRRPNGVMLINGARLDRVSGYRPEEKGLILASDLPVYVKGNFNFHRLVEKTTPVEEFTTPLSPLSSKDWDTTFYTRSALDENFACRNGDPRLPTGKCGTGDQWRSATIVTDAITLLSGGFRAGFRDEGDYDLRNNLIDAIADPDNTPATPNINPAATIRQARRNQGFWDNNFVTNGLSSRGFTFDKDAIKTGSPSVNLTPNPAGPDKQLTDAFYSGNDPDAINSSYFNNFVTPVQRRAIDPANPTDDTKGFPEYVMEICRKLPVSECQPGDWVVGYNSDGNTTFTSAEQSVTASQLVPDIPNAGGAPSDLTGAAQANLLIAGTTARPALAEADRRFPRRVAFLRNAANQLQLVTLRPAPAAILTPIPLGITDRGTEGKVYYYPYGNTTINPPDPSGVTTDPGPQNYRAFSATNLPRLRANALWYQTTGGNFTDPTPTKRESPTIRPKNFRELPLRYLTALTAPTTQQPLLLPLLQLQVTTQLPKDDNVEKLLKESKRVEDTQWLARASGDTTFNMLMATGDNPSRPPTGADLADLNGGLANLPHFLENWNARSTATTNTALKTNISGSFIQLKRSNYASAPWWSIPPVYKPSGGIFNYPQSYKTNSSAHDID